MNGAMIDHPFKFKGKYILEELGWCEILPYAKSRRWESIECDDIGRKIELVNSLPGTYHFILMHICLLFGPSALFCYLWNCV